jgi:hypothetical protein
MPILDRREPTPERDLRSIGGGARRPIPWEHLDTGALGERGRATVGGAWRRRREQEHLAVGAFALLAQELAEDGCDAIVLSLVTRASSDEVRHAEICRRFAAALLGSDDVPPRVRGLPKVPMHDRATSAERVLFHMVEMCCLSETLTGVYLTEMVARTIDPVARQALESLLEDEIDHGRVGWAYLTARARERRLGGLAGALPAMLDRTFRPVLNAAASATSAEEAKLETCGYLSARTAEDLYKRALRDVIVPGFERLGIDLGPSRQLAREAGWAEPRP